MKTRKQLAKQYQNNLDKIKKLESDNKNLLYESYLLCDKKQYFTEEIEDVLISGRPKIYEKQLTGKIHWKQKIYDSAYPNDNRHSITLDRTQIVRINGEWIFKPMI